MAGMTASSGGQVGTDELSAYVERYAPDVHLLLAPDGTILHVGRSSARVGGWRPEDLLGRNALDLLHPEDVDYAVGNLVEAARHPGRHGLVELRVARPDGSWLMVEVAAFNPPEDPECRVILALRDITDRGALPDRRRKLERAVLRVAARCAGISSDAAERVLTDGLAAIGDCLVAHEVVLTVVDPSDSSVSSWGWRAHEDIGWSPSVSDASDLRSIAASVTQPGRPLAEEGPWPRDLLTVGVADAGPADGLVTVRWHGTEGRLTWDEGNLYLLDALCRVLVMTARRVGRERMLAHQASHDPLTGLANRTHLTAALDQQLARVAQGAIGGVGVVFCDLDCFKEVNDGYGHTAGDRLLVAVAAQLTAAGRRVDLAGRVGGDEFVLVCPGLTSLDAARALVGRLAAGVGRPVEVVGGVHVLPSASVGMAIVRGEDAGSMSAEELLSVADTAMYASKHAPDGAPRFVEVRPGEPLTLMV